MMFSSLPDIVSRRIILFAGVLGLIPVLLTGISGEQAEAHESFTVTSGFYQGFSLVEGISEIDPFVLTLIFNPSDRVELILGPGHDDLFNYAVADFSVAYDLASHRPTIVAEQLQALAVLEDHSFDEVTYAMLADLEFDPAPPPVVLESNDLLVFLTADQHYYLLGDIVQLPDWTVQFSYQPIENHVIPEPASLLLVGLGIVGCVVSIRRQQRQNMSKGGTL